jgi:hypothetical protein
MPPKQTKKITTDNATKDEKSESSSNLITIKKEWIDNVNDIIGLRDRLVILEKRNEEIINKIWEIMNKNPSEQIIIESVQKEEIKTIKSKKTEETDDSDTKPKATATKVSAKSKAKPEVENEDSETKPKATSGNKASAKSKPKPEVESDDEKPAPVKKATPAKKETKDTKETKKTATAVIAVTAPKGKISAPSKGTPKPKLVESDDEKPKPNLNNDDSSDTEVDSLSSV